MHIVSVLKKRVRGSHRILTAVSDSNPATSGSRIDLPASLTAQLCLKPQGWDMSFARQCMLFPVVNACPRVSGGQVVPLGPEQHLSLCVSSMWAQNQSCSVGTLVQAPKDASRH